MQFSFLLINLEIKDDTFEWDRGGDSTMFVARCSCFNFDLSTQCATYLIEQQRQELTNCGASAIGHHKSHVAASAETLLQLQLRLDPWLGSACLQLQQRRRLRVGRMPRRLRRWWQSQNVRPAVIVHAKRQRWSLLRSLLSALACTCVPNPIRSVRNWRHECKVSWKRPATATTTTTKLYRCERCIRRCCHCRCCCCRPNRVRLAINPRCETMSVCVQVCCCCCCCCWSAAGVKLYNDVNIFMAHNKINYKICSAQSFFCG